jgi:selenocysteine lyase/cysteine desulfurase
VKRLVSNNDFPSARNFTYLNTANVGLMLNNAENEINYWVKDLSQNGSNNFNEIAEQNVFSGLHKAAARLINVSSNDIAAGSSATELLCSLAWAIMPSKDQNVVSTNIVFPSTIYPWMRVASSTGCIIRLAKEKHNLINTQDIVELIDDNTSVVCISHVEYSNGQVFDLDLLSEVAHKHNALLIVDATQSAGAIPINVQKTPVDAIVCGAYKWLCGPFGAAFMYVTPDLSEKLEPGLVGFRSHKKMWELDASRIEYSNSAEKFEFSTMAFGCALGLTKSIDKLNQIGVESIFKYNRELVDILVEGLLSRSAVITAPIDNSRSSIVTAYFKNKDSNIITERLKKRKVYVSTRGSTIRISPHLYNTIDDIRNTLNQVDSIIANI